MIAERLAFLDVTPFVHRSVDVLAGEHERLVDGSGFVQRALELLFATFYTSFLAFEIYETVTDGLWWQWLLAAVFLLLSVLGWVSLIWVLRHPQPAPGRAPSEPPRIGDLEDG